MKYKNILVFNTNYAKLLVQVVFVYVALNGSVQGTVVCKT